LFSLEKRLQQVQRLHFEQQIDELRIRLIETEQQNDYLKRKIDELHKTSAVQTPQTSSSVVPVLLPDPK
jgi:predicted RNase H-like nuclease (RuvC/YqgF family)